MEKAVLARKPQRCLRRSVSLKGQGFQGEWPSLPNTERAQRTEELALPKHLRHVRHLTQPPFHLIISTNLHSRNSHSHFTEEMRTQAQEKASRARDGWEEAKRARPAGVWETAPPACNCEGPEPPRGPPPQPLVSPQPPERARGSETKLEHNTPCWRLFSGPSLGPPATQASAPRRPLSPDS
ncbi:uncharacterized protein LOC117065798 isoform X3 [Trachypithecus francoisi]|uniref:uncharacterized protein LOC117065798 isoform X3 n=1 Tax=Trachypithecus francoisi TaxID=54180 RepID=UPI00141BF3B5|nr:uncharacterized protein LOC117065798 isoform X3 [Trachypithecus francoisi]